MVRRSGVTLMEVLVAIFVSAIGLLALLALFPVGAISMYQAIKDSRCAQAANNATAIAEIQQVRQDPSLFPPSFASSDLAQSDAFTNPSTYIPGSSPAALVPNLNTPFTYPSGLIYDGPGYPVYIDPLGANFAGVAAAPGLFWPPGGPASPINWPVIGYCAGASSPGFLRLTPSFVGSTQQVLRFFTLLDDITFGLSGTPIGPTNVITTLPIVEREGRYSWAYLLRRPRYAAPGVVDLTIVVYSGRSPAVLGENPYAVDFVQGQSSVLVSWNPSLGQDKPAIRPGGWILDATVIDRITNAPTVTPDPHGFFYRVVGVTETTLAGLPALLVELQTNIRQGSGGAGAGSQQGVLVVMDNVVEVFEKGPGRLE